MLTVITSGKAAPGVTTSAWALALAWPGPVIVADCDPAGGDMAAGFLPGRVSQDRGLLSWSSSARRGIPALTAATMLAEHAVELPEQPNVWLLPGFTNATQGYSFTEDVWERLGLALARSAAAINRDALVDTGRLVGDGANWPVLRAADQVLVAVRPTVRSVHGAQAITARLRYELGDLSKVGALVIGDGPYSAREVASALGLTLAGTLPTDRAAAALSDGAIASVRKLERSALVKAAAGVARRLSAEHQQNGSGFATAQVQR